MAKRIDSTAYVVVLLGGEAGLRAGEMRALVWTDADLKRQLRIERNEWQGHISYHKGRQTPVRADDHQVEAHDARAACSGKLAWRPLLGAV